MNCNALCAVGIVLLTANLTVTLTAVHNGSEKHFYRSLTVRQRMRYKAIVEERRTLYLQGLLCGVILAAFAIAAYRSFRKDRYPPAAEVCMPGGIALLTTYLYYLLSPKSDYMILHLDSRALREEWMKITQAMTRKYHLGLLLGVVGVGFVGGAACGA